MIYVNIKGVTETVIFALDLITHSQVLNLLKQPICCMSHSYRVEGHNMLDVSQRGMDGAVTFIVQTEIRQRDLTALGL